MSAFLTCKSRAPTLARSLNNYDYEPRCPLPAPPPKPAASPWDAVHACNSGHLGLPLGLRGNRRGPLRLRAFRTIPPTRKWLNRDRFVLSAGHGSMFLYSWLHLSGYASVDHEQVKKFRAPRLAHARPSRVSRKPPGVEAHHRPARPGCRQCRRLRRFAGKWPPQNSTRPSTPFSTTTSIAPRRRRLHAGRPSRWKPSPSPATFKLDNLILIYGLQRRPPSTPMALETPERKRRPSVFGAIEWGVQTIDGKRPERVPRRLRARPKPPPAKPQIIIAHTLIGKGIPEVAGHRESPRRKAARNSSTPPAKPSASPKPSTSSSAPRTRAFFPRTRPSSSPRNTIAWKSHLRRVADRQSRARQRPRRRAEKTKSPPTSSRASPSFPADAKNRHP